MKSRRIAMSLDHFFTMPRLPGWKYEYIDSRAYVTPLHYLVYSKIPVTASELSGYQWRSFSNDNMRGYRRS